MSYCRFGEGDVYIFLDVSGYLCCCGCSLGTWSHFSTEAMLGHLEQHREVGDHVPDFVFENLARDAEENDRRINEGGSL